MKSISWQLGPVQQNQDLLQFEFHSVSVSFLAAS